MAHLLPIPWEDLPIPSWDPRPSHRLVASPPCTMFCSVISSVSRISITLLSSRVEAGLWNAKRATCFGVLT